MKNVLNVNFENNELRPIRETSFVIPKPNGEQKVFLMSLKPDSPVEYLTLGGLSFHKVTVSAMCGSKKYRDQKGSNYVLPTKLYCSLSKNQFDALLGEAVKRLITYRTSDGQIKSCTYASLMILKEEVNVVSQDEDITLEKFYDSNSNPRGEKKNKQQ